MLPDLSIPEAGVVFTCHGARPCVIFPAINVTLLLFCSSLQFPNCFHMRDFIP